MAKSACARAHWEDMSGFLQLDDPPKRWGEIRNRACISELQKKSKLDKTEVDNILTMLGSTNPIGKGAQGLVYALTGGDGVKMAYKTVKAPSSHDVKECELQEKVHSLSPELTPSCTMVAHSLCKEAEDAKTLSCSCSLMKMSWVQGEDMDGKKDIHGDLLKPRYEIGDIAKLKGLTKAIKDHMEMASVNVAIWADLPKFGPGPRNIVHNDIKPANLMYHNGKVTVVDWGVAAKSGKPDFGSGTALFLPLEAYWPSVLATSKHDVKNHVSRDVYSWGVTILDILGLDWKELTGGNTFPGNVIKKVVREHCADVPVSTCLKDETVVEVMFDVGKELKEAVTEEADELNLGTKEKLLVSMANWMTTLHEHMRPTCKDIQTRSTKILECLDVRDDLVSSCMQAPVGQTTLAN